MGAFDANERQKLEALFRTANSILGQQGERRQFRSLLDFTPEVLYELFDVVCGPSLMEKPALSVEDCKKYPVSLLQAVIDIIAMDFLNVDIAPLITGNKLVAREFEAIEAFLTILKRLMEILNEEEIISVHHSPETSVSNQKWEKSVQLEPPLRRFGKKSVLYSPNTAFKRSGQRSRITEKATKDLIRKNRPTILNPLYHAQVLERCRPSDLKLALHNFQMKQIALEQRDLETTPPNMKDDHSKHVSNFQRCLDAHERQREQIDIRRARLALKNAKHFSRRRKAMDSIKREDVRQKFVARKIKMEAEKEAAVRKFTESVETGMNLARKELRLKVPKQKSNVRTVLDRIRILENRQMRRENEIRNKDNR